MNLSPIVIFNYNRLDHSREVIESLRKAKHGEDSLLILVSDGAKSEKDQVAVDQLRDYLSTVQWKAGIRTIFHKKNKGLAENITSTLNQLFQEYESLIVLEDDIVVAEDALLYFNNALETYKDDQQVYHISGFVEPIDSAGIPDYSLYPMMSCWGWASWRSRWQHLEMDAYQLLQEIYQNPKHLERFKSLGINLHKDLVLNCEGTMSTWAVLWNASVCVQEGFALVPNQTFITNIGHDESGENCETTEVFKSATFKKFVEIDTSKVDRSDLMDERVLEFYGNPNFDTSMKSKIPREIKDAVKFLKDSGQRGKSLTIEKIKQLNRFEAQEINWEGKKITIIDNVSFLEDYKWMYEKDIISSYPITNNAVVDLNPKEGLMQQFFQDYFPDAKQFLSEKRALNVEVLKSNAKDINYTNIEFEKLDKFSDIDFLRMDIKTEGDIEVLKGIISKVKSTLIYLNATGGNYNLFIELLNLLNKDFVVDIESVGLMQDKAFNHIYRQNTQLYLSAYTKD